jgi:hypothetical protein
MKANRCSRLAAACAALLALGCVSSVAAQAGSGRPRARAARTIDLQETASLHVTHNKGMSLEAEGKALGTIRGRLLLRIHVETISQMSVSFSGSGGSSTLAGEGSGRYTISGSTLRFKGTSKIIRGSGTYAHASGSGIRFEGTLNRVKGTIAMSMSGQFHT